MFLTYRKENDNLYIDIVKHTLEKEAVTIHLYRLSYKMIYKY